MAEIDNLKSTGSMKTTGGSKKYSFFCKYLSFLRELLKADTI